MKAGYIFKTDWQFSNQQVLFTTNKEELEKKWEELKNANWGDSFVKCFTDEYGQEHLTITPKCGGLSAEYGWAQYKKISNL